MKYCTLFLIVLLPQPTFPYVQCSTIENKLNNLKKPNKYDYIAHSPAITPSIIIMVNHIYMLDAPTDPSPIGVIYMMICRSPAA